MQPEFKEYQKRILDNAKTMATEFVNAGFHVVAGGTDTHLMLLSFIGKGITGKDVEKALEKAGITVNKNTVPFDPEKPFVTSGIRIGTPAVTTRGMGPAEMKQIASMITRAIGCLKDDEALAGIRKEVSALCDKFPLYAALR